MRKFQLKTVPTCWKNSNIYIYNSLYFTRTSNSSMLSVVTADANSISGRSIREQSQTLRNLKGFVKGFCRYPSTLTIRVHAFHSRRTILHSDHVRKRHQMYWYSWQARTFFVYFCFSIEWYAICLCNANFELAFQFKDFVIRNVFTNNKK